MGHKRLENTVRYSKLDPGQFEGCAPREPHTVLSVERPLISLDDAFCSIRANERLSLTKLNRILPFTTGNLSLSDIPIGDHQNDDDHSEHDGNHFLNGPDHRRTCTKFVVSCQSRR